MVREGGGGVGDRRASFSLSTPPPFLPACESLPLRPQIQTMQSGRSVIPNPARRFRSGAACEKRRRRASSIRERRGGEESQLLEGGNEGGEEGRSGRAGALRTAGRERGDRREGGAAEVLSLSHSLSLLSATPPHPRPLPLSTPSHPCQTD